MNELLFIFNPTTMSNGRRKFTDEQKLEILKQAEQIGINKALRHHSLSYSVFSRWREKFSSNDENKQETLMRNKTKWELKQYMEENARLKKIIAYQALELERKDEELRKGNSMYGKR
ncbi:MAG TPA: transposase [Chitinophagaceae bacterium]